MRPGLSVLLAFLFFVIIEKFVTTINGEAIIPEQQPDETPINDASEAKEIDNNNCIMLNTEKNGFAKECFKNSTEVNFLYYLKLM